MAVRREEEEWRQSRTKRHRTGKTRRATIVRTRSHVRGLDQDEQEEEVESRKMRTRFGKAALGQPWCKKIGRMRERQVIDTCVVHAVC